MLENEIFILSPNHRIEVKVSCGSVLLDESREKFIAEVKQLLSNSCYYNEEVEGYDGINQFNFDGTLKPNYYEGKNFDLFDTQWEVVLKPKIKELAKSSFAKPVLHFDASHKLLGPAIDHRYEPDDPISSAFQIFSILMIVFAFLVFTASRFINFFTLW